MYKTWYSFRSISIFLCYQCGAGKSEVEHALRLIKGYRIDYPVYLDMEDESQGNLSATEFADIAETFADIIEASGRWGGSMQILTGGRIN